MFALKCAGCGQQVDVSKRDGDVHCPRCGHLVSSKSEPQAGAIAAEKSLGSFRPGGDASGQEDTDNDETLSPVTSGEFVTFPFLSPAQGPNELGWLAHYRVIRLLGQGGMGIVFEAIDTQLQRPVALKVLKPDIAKDDQARQRFLREARATASVQSDYIVVIHQVSQVDTLPFLAMEFLRGEPLDKWLDRHGRPALHETLRIGVEIARALAAAHERGLIHRDIKPANIWLENRDERRGPRDAKTASPPSPRAARVKVLDFGLVRAVSEKGNLTHAGMVLGTPAYMAPEQAEGGEVDARCDLFSLGCVLYELATGAKPFSGTTTMAILMAVAMKPPLPPLDLNPGLPPALGELILHLLAKKPADRPGSAQEVADSLEELMGELGLSTQTPPSGISRVRYAAPTISNPAVARPRRLLPILATILALSIIAPLAAWFLYAWLGPRDDEILIGMSGPFSGPSKELGREMALGIDLYFQHINDKGGVHGRKLKLIPLDDGYEPADALVNVKELHEKRKVFALLGNIGTPTAALTVPYASENKLLFFGAFTGAKLLRKDPPDRYVFNYRASYLEETAKIVEYLVEIRKDKVRPEQIAVFCQNDGYGDAGFEGVVKVMRDKYKRNADDIVRVYYDRNKIQVNDAVQTILKHPELRAVVMVSTYKPAAEFIRQLKVAKRDLIFTNVSFVGSEALADGLMEFDANYAEGVIVTQVVPPIDSGASIVREYKELLKRYHQNERPSFTSLEGYISSAVFVEALKRAGPHPTSEKLIETLETIRNLDIGTGAKLSFSKSEHQASHKVWGTVIDNAGKFKVLELQ